MHSTNTSDSTSATLSTEPQLNATADVAGSFGYTPAAGTKLNANPGQALKVDFTPADAANYNKIGRASCRERVKVTPVVAWANPTEITEPMRLSGTQLKDAA